MNERIKTALAFLKDGQSFSVGELRLGAEKYGVLEVIGWSRYLHFVQLTKNQCIRELEEMKEQFYGMLDVSPELMAFTLDKSIRFTLCFNDCGKGSIELCSETEKQLTWKADVNEIKVVLSPTRFPKK